MTKMRACWHWRNIRLADLVARMGTGSKPLASHQKEVECSGYEQADEPGIIIKPTHCRNHESDQGGQNSREKRDKRFGIESLFILVSPVPPVKIRDQQLPIAQEEIIANHDAGDRAQQRRTSDQPAKNVRVLSAQQFPRHHEHTKYSGDPTSGPGKDCRRG